MINAINHIHSHKIIHCDIKPSNILKSQQRIYKICDFDLSSQLDHFQDSTSIMKGYTKYYMSPEQEEWINNQNRTQSYKIEITQKSDVFNLGVVFLEVLGEEINEYSSLRIRQGNYFFSTQVMKSQWFEKVLMMVKPNPNERIHSSQLFGLLYPLELFSLQNYESLLNIFESTCMRINLQSNVQQSISQSEAAYELIQKLNLGNNIPLYGLVLIYKSRQLRLSSKLDESLEIGLLSLKFLQTESNEYLVLSLLEVAQTYEQIGIYQKTYNTIKSHQGKRTCCEVRVQYGEDEQEARIIPSAKYQTIQSI
ncbi:kinase domain protein (macronuclear) [Tetrahymena thermophila SB210]|uniref:Kinase domain protein n=1 Tax=Tetrahymena thermophila (strain SB210) TaxID=312017 RepID=W7XJP6_TETTS|nr:kinase domain protein [Tetrahymena thermophila SB210]EWS75761.1 kinase domain protein [Tetrahymena thermophila SB210]|eukprot:XP_012651683.1 kinase domain protein [Tetrahymena thermophila SB210]